MPQAPDDAHHEVGLGFAQRHQFRQQIPPPTQLLAEAEDAVERGTQEQADQEHRQDQRALNGIGYAKGNRQE